MTYSTKRTIYAAIALLSMVLSIALSACAPKEPPAHVYIALGDSVPAGFGVAPEERYTDIFFEKLRSEGIADEYYNYAENGCTTSMLLGFLKSMEGFESFSEVSVITLNVGGNNILVPFREYLPDMDELKDGIAELTEFISESKETISESLELAAEARELLDEFSVLDILKLVSFIQKAIPILEDVADVMQNAEELDLLELAPLLLGSFPEKLDAELQKGVEAFSAEFGEIIKWIKAHAPNAVIIVNTVYNPIPQDSLGILTGLHARADELTQSINEIISQGAETGGYLVSDVYAGFYAEPNVADVLNFSFDTDAMTLNYDIIHPNSAGHKLIAELNYKTLEGYIE